MTHRDRPSVPDPQPGQAPHAPALTANARSTPFQSPPPPNAHTAPTAPDSAHTKPKPKTSRLHRRTPTLSTNNPTSAKRQPNRSPQTASTTDSKAANCPAATTPPSITPIASPQPATAPRPDRAGSTGPAASQPSDHESFPPHAIADHVQPRPWQRTYAQRHGRHHAPPPPKPGRASPARTYVPHPWGHTSSF